MISAWHQFYRKREGPSRDIVGSGREFVFFSPRSTRSMARLLCGDQLNYDIDDLYDISQFCEDFVLVDYIGLPNGLFHYIGPYFIEHAVEDSLPFFSAVETVSAIWNGTASGYWHPSTGGKLDAEIETISVAMKNHSNTLASLKRRIVKKPNPKLMKELSEFADSYASDTEKLIDVFARQQKYFRDRTNEIYFDRVLGDSDEAPEPPDEAALSFVEKSIRSSGLPISFSSKFRPFQQDLAAKALSQRILGEITDSLDLDAVRKLVKPSAMPVPPIFALAVSRCGKRGDFIKVLCELREEFKGLRNEVNGIQLDINADIPLREKLKIAHKIDRLKASAINSFKHGGPMQSIVCRTWDIVKQSGLTVGALLQTADSIIQHGKDNVAIGGMQKYTELASFYGSVRDTSTKVNRLFGDAR